MHGIIKGIILDNKNYRSTRAWEVLKMRNDPWSLEIHNSNSLVFAEAGLRADQYHDENHYKLELEKIFYRNWIYACHTSQLPKMGRPIKFNICNQNFILFRNSRNNFSAFLDVVRQRSSRLWTEDRGYVNSKLLKCPYHQ